MTARQARIVLDLLQLTKYDGADQIVRVSDHQLAKRNKIHRREISRLLKTLPFVSIKRGSTVKADRRATTYDLAPLLEACVLGPITPVDVVAEELTKRTSDLEYWVNRENKCRAEFASGRIKQPDLDWTLKDIVYHQEQATADIARLTRSKEITHVQMS
jgi:hypothetical protein